ncbi:hypothetical protein [Pseudarthrobacter sp. NBSH8]|nr:hypothetical protein [Pseudarthrobacter sp. NBSH8]
MVAAAQIQTMILPADIRCGGRRRIRAEGLGLRLGIPQALTMAWVVSLTA